MAWADLAPKIDSILDALELDEAPELFNIQLVPLTKADGTYCLWPDALLPNVEWTDQSDRLYPVNQFRISLIFELGNNRKELRDAAMTTVEQVVVAVVNPDNRSAKTRVVKHLGSRTRLLKEEGYWAIVDMIFQAQYEVR